MLTITTGKLSPRPPILRHPDELVEVLDRDNQRRRTPARELAEGDVLYGFGVIARIERAAEAA